MKVDELLFILFIFCFFIMFALLGRHIFLSQKCLYSMGLVKYKNLFISTLMGEGAGFQHTRWISKILSDRMEIPEKTKPLVNKVKYNYKLIKLGYLTLFTLILIMFLAHYYKWKI